MKITSTDKLTKLPPSAETETAFKGGSTSRNVGQLRRNMHNGTRVAAVRDF